MIFGMLLTKGKFLGPTVKVHPVNSCSYTMEILTPKPRSANIVLLFLFIVAWVEYAMCCGYHLGMPMKLQIDVSWDDRSLKV